MKYLKILSLSMLILAACNNNEEQINNLKQENEELRQLALKKDSTVNSLMSSFNEIESNLQVIKQKEHVISKTIEPGAEDTKDVGDRIQEDINTINDLMQRNKDLVAKLKSEMAKSNVKIDEFNKMIDRLREKIEIQSITIDSLRVDLTKANIKVDVLTSTVDTLHRKLETKSEELNTAYYVIGEFKELQEKNILTKQGGFLGLGKEEKLKPSFNRDAFTKINILQTKQIPVESDEVKLMTAHPENSYELRKEIGKTIIFIKDPKEFWSTSKYLVIVKD